MKTGLFCDTLGDMAEPAIDRARMAGRRGRAVAMDRGGNAGRQPSVDVTMADAPFRQTTFPVTANVALCYAHQRAGAWYGRTRGIKYLLPQKIGQIGTISPQKTPPQPLRDETLGQRSYNLFVINMLRCAPERGLLAVNPQTKRARTPGVTPDRLGLFIQLP